MSNRSLSRETHLFRPIGRGRGELERVIASGGCSEIMVSVREMRKPRRNVLYPRLRGFSFPAAAASFFSGLRGPARFQADSRLGKRGGNPDLFKKQKKISHIFPPAAFAKSKSDATAHAGAGSAETFDFLDKRSIANERERRRQG